MWRGVPGKRQDEGEFLAVDGNFFGGLAFVPVIGDGAFEGVSLGILVVVCLQEMQFPVALRFGFHTAKGDFADGGALGDGLGQASRDGDFAYGLRLFSR